MSELVQAAYPFVRCKVDESRLALLDDKTADRLRRKYRKALEALM